MLRKFIRSGKLRRTGSVKRSEVLFEWGARGADKGGAFDWADDSNSGSHEMELFEWHATGDCAIRVLGGDSGGIERRHKFFELDAQDVRNLCERGINGDWEMRNGDCDGGLESGRGARGGVGDLRGWSTEFRFHKRKDGIFFARYSLHEAESPIDLEIIAAVTARARSPEVVRQRD
jgi:hypothetical protein